MSFYGDPGVSKAFTADKLLLLDPRLGITWAPGGSQKQVVRIGAGIFRDATAAWYGQRLTSDPPGIDEIDLTQSFSSLAAGNFCGTTSNPWEYYTPGGCIGATGSTPTPAQLAYKGPFPSINDFPANALWVVIPPDMKPTYVVQWTLSYQAQLWRNWMMSITYLGNKSTDMPFGYSYNFSETPVSNIGAANLCSLPSATATGVICTSGNEPQRAYLNVLAGGATTTYNSSGVATGISSSGAVGCAQATLTCKVATNLGYNELSTGMEMGTDSNNANYNGLIASLQHRFGQGFTLNANYTYSHCFDDIEPQNDLNGVSGYIEQTNWALNYGPCEFDIRQMFNASIVASSPVSGHNWKGWILGGWQIAPNLRVVSGLPVDPLQGDNSLTGGNTNGSFYSFAPGYGIQNVYANALNNGYQYYNQAPFYITACTTAACTATTTLNPAYAVTANCTPTSPATTCTVAGNVYASGALLPYPISASTFGGSGQFGNISRNLLRAPGAINLDLSVSRMIPIHEAMQLELRFDAFNILNHWNPQAPATGSLTSGTSGSTFGYITGAGLSGVIPSQYDPRVLQIALKFHW
jgi:hypothetical protein